MPDHVDVEASGADDLAPAAPARRPRRWLRRVAIGLTIFLVALVAGAWWLLAHLHTPLVKTRVQAAVAEATGLHLDYDTLSVSPLSGLSLRGLRVGMPPPWDALEPDLVRLESLEVEFRLGDLVGAVRTVAAVRVRGLHVGLALDPTGTCLDPVIARLPPSAPKEPEPLSRALLGLATGPALALTRLEVGAVSARAVMQRPDGTLDAWTVSVPALAIADARIGDGALDIHLRMGEPAAPTTILATREQPKAEVALTLALALDVTPSQVDLRAQLDLARQDLVARLPELGPLARIAASVRLDPGAQRTEIALREAVLLAGAATATTQVTLRDGVGATVEPHVQALAISADPAILARFVPPELGHIDYAGTPLGLRLLDVTVDPAEPLAARGRIELGGQIRTLDVAAAGIALHAQDLALEGSGTLGDADGARLVVRVPVASLTATAPGASVTLSGLALGLSAEGLRLVDGKPSGRARAGFEVAKLEARAAGADLKLSGLAANVEAPIPDGPIQARGALRIASLEGGAKDQGIAGAATRLQAKFDVRDLDPSWARPAHVNAGLDLELASAQLPGVDVSLSRPTAQISANLRSPTRFDVGGALGFGSLRVRLGSSAEALVRRLQIKADLDGVELDTARPLASRALARVRGTIAEIQHRQPGSSTSLDGVEIDLESRLTGSPPYSVQLDVPVRRIAMRGHKGAVVLPPAPGKATLSVTDLVLNASAPGRSRAHVEGTVAFGPLQSDLTVDKGADDVRVSLSAKASSLGLVRPLLPPAFARRFQAPLETMALSAGGEITVRELSRRSRMDLDVQLNAALERPGLRADGVDVGARRLELQIASSGGLTRHEADLVIAVTDPRMGEAVASGRTSAKAHVKVDLGAPHLALRLSTDARTGPRLEANVDAGLEPWSGALRWNIQAAGSELGVVGAVLPSDVRKQADVAWQRLGFEVTGEGALSGVLLGMDRHGKPQLAPDPAASARGKGNLNVVVTGLDLKDPTGQRVEMPAARVGLGIDAQADVPKVDLRLQVPTLRLSSPTLRVDLDGLVTRLDLTTTGRPPEGDLLATWELTANGVKQDAVPLYAIGKVSASATLKADQDGILRVTSLRVSNPAGGTELELKGGLDWTQRLGLLRRDKAGAGGARGQEGVPGRQSLSLEGTLTQDLAPLSNVAARLRGQGRVRLPFQLESGDLQLFRLVAALHMEDVHLVLEDQKLEVHGASGSVPILEDIALDPKTGPVVLGGAAINAYSRMRFGDLHPFLSGRHFLSIKEIKAFGSSIGPLAGNARVDRNLIGIDQLELGWMGGNVTGQCLVDYRDKDSQILFRGAITGVQPSGGGSERLDANAAVLLQPLRLQLEGRAEVLRVGKQHLLDLLNVWDPYAADVNANRVRLGLKAGYPKAVRLRFQHGFASFAIELGGLASTVRIDEIQGVPLGPVLTRFIGPLLETQSKPKESP